MKINDKSMGFIIESAGEIQKAAVSLDLLKKMRFDSDTLYRASKRIEDLAFSILMVAMGEHVPKSLWSIKDYGELYELLDNAKDDLEIHDDW